MPASPTPVTFGRACALAFARGDPRLDGRILVCTTERMLGRFPDLFSAMQARAEATIATEQMNESSLDSVTRLLTNLRPRAPFATVVAVGGGSVLDTAKALCIGLSPHARAVPFTTVIADPGAFAADVIPLLAIPTTAGTGSEVTMWGTVWDTTARRKLSIAHPSLFPEHAFVDADLSMTMPARLTAVTGFDALSHAMETMWNTGHTEASDALAKEALGLVMANLATAVEEPANAEARLAMARAATLAGQGISYTTTAAAHAISYPLTLFHGIDHGIACSITLPALLRLNAQADASRTAHILDAMHVASVNEGVDALRALFEHCGMPTTLAELGVEERDLERLVANAFDPARMGNNIRPLTEAEVRRLLAQLL